MLMKAEDWDCGVRGVGGNDDDIRELRRTELRRTERMNGGVMTEFHGG